MEHIEQKQTKKIAKGAIYYNNPKNDRSPKYKGKVTTLDGKVYEAPIWFNGEIGPEGPSEGFNIGFNIEEVLNPEPPKDRPVSQAEAKESWGQVREAAGLNEGEPPKKEDDVQF